MLEYPIYCGPPFQQVLMQALYSIVVFHTTCEEVSSSAIYYKCILFFLSKKFSFQSYAVIGYLGPFVLSQYETFLLTIVKCVFYFPIYTCSPVFPCHCQHSTSNCKVEKFIQFEPIDPLLLRPYSLPLIHDDFTAITPHIPVISFPYLSGYIIALKYEVGGFRIVALQSSLLRYTWRCPTNNHRINFSINIQIESNLMVGTYLLNERSVPFQTARSGQLICIPTKCSCSPSVSIFKNSFSDIFFSF